jgi:hypothetical protein
MTPELIALVGGGFSGFIFKLIGTLVQAQQANIQSMLQIVMIEPLVEEENG